MELIKKFNAFFESKGGPEVEAFKEVLRLGVFTGLSFLITAGLDALLTADATNLWVAVGIALLRWADKWLHASGRLERGLTRF